MRQRPYIFRRKLRDKTSKRAVLLGFAGYLLLAPPAFAHLPKPQAVVHVCQKPGPMRQV